ncbi:hypothetical protein GQS_09140 [Thermococcus sp. 4557]|uniref:hypothetical protein n=1 Tax=Thermococcus sp. (strain CGMCC 1.5172 / 4557) TaxID=1042877 RepID=UPI000219EF86|nr:hypothetical protein [Thermococcus sp. 4557]AEK73722.1 hypothetical protein GQS_09140 [Thermococcus sp. 4557]
MNPRIRRELARKLELARDEIEDGLRYGVPHLVGEIRNAHDDNGGSPDLSLSVVVFESARHSFVIREDGSTFFMYPAENSNHRRLFFNLWRFLDGKNHSEGRFEPGMHIRGILRSAIQRAGFEVLWINVRPAGRGEYIDVWATKDGVRYNMLFEKIASGEYVLLEIEKV